MMFGNLRYLFTIKADYLSKRAPILILFITAKTSEPDLMYGLGLGADNYIKKPFGAGELRARVNAHLRRENRKKQNVLLVSDLNSILLPYSITVKGEKLPFTVIEYGICEFLARNRGQVFFKKLLPLENTSENKK